MSGVAPASSRPPSLDKGGVGGGSARGLVRCLPEGYPPLTPPLSREGDRVRCGARADLNKSGVTNRRSVGRGLLAAALAMASPALADPTMAPDRLAYSQLPDPAQEARAATLMQTLRCVVCQGQSIADSDADLAGDMRALVRHRIAAGEKPEDVRHWLVQRYGSWVSYTPPVEPLTWPLWLAPIALVAGGLWLSRGTFRKRRR